MAKVITFVISKVAGFLAIFFMGWKAKETEVIKEDLEDAKEELERLNARPRTRGDAVRLFDLWIERKNKK